MPVPLAQVQPPKVIQRRPSRAGRDIHTQRRYDHRRKLGWTQFEARHTAVVEARAAIRRGERGAKWALRQALVDLAACCEELCLPMTAPDETLVAS